MTSELRPYFELMATFDHQLAVAMDMAHNMFITASILAKKPRHVIELGHGTGYVTIGLLHAMHYNGRGKQTLVDNWLEWQGKEPENIASFRQAGVNVVGMGEEEFVRSTETDACDFLVSDADHYRSHSWLDEHLRIVEPDGFLFFHDTNQPEVFPGLAMLVPEVIRRRLPHVHFTQSSRPDERCHRGLLFVVNKK